MVLNLSRILSHACVAGFTAVLLGFAAEQASAQTAAPQTEAVHLTSVHELRQLINDDSALGTPLEINCKKAGELGIPFEFCGGVGGALDERRRSPLVPTLVPLQTQPGLTLTPDGLGIRITFPLR